MLDPCTVETIDSWRVTRGDFAAVDADEPWALPLVVRVEKDAPPAHTETLEAAATAVVRLLTHAHSCPSGPWHPVLARWMNGRIRKVSRRARGAKWEVASSQPGAVAAVGDAFVAALLPHPVGQAPAAVAKLQVSGLELSDPTPPGATSSLTRAVVGDDTADSAAVQLAPWLDIVLSPHTQISTGKACAQVGHAAQVALMRCDRDRVLAWAEAEFPLTVRTPEPSEWAELTVAQHSDVVLIRDAGFTEIAPGTLTCAAVMRDAGART